MTGSVAESAPADKMRATKHRRHRTYLFFALCSTLYLFPFMRLFLQGDQGTLLTGAVRVMHGQVYARDFFEVMGPGTFYWAALFMKLFGTNFLATRICLFVTSLGTGLLLYFLSRQICRSYAVLPCILLGATYCFRLWPTVSHHGDSNFFALASVAAIAWWHRTQNKWLLVAAGAFAAITTCVLQPKGIYLLLAVMLWLLIQNRRHIISISSLGLFLAGYTGVSLLVSLYFWSKGALGDLIYAMFIWPRISYGVINAVPYARGLLSYYWDIWSFAKHGPGIVAGAALLAPYVLVAALPGLLLLFGSIYRKDSLKPLPTLYWLCGLALWLSEIHRKDIAHLVFGSPLFLVLSVFYLLQIRHRAGKWALQILAVCAASLLTFNLFIALTARPVTTRVGAMAMFHSDYLIELLEQRTHPGEEIFVYPYRPAYYFLTGTVNPARYSILTYGYNTPAQFQEVVQTLEQHQVRYIVWDSAFAKVELPLGWPAAKWPESNSLIVEPYIESHYHAVWSDPENAVRLMERNDRKPEGALH